MRLPNDIGLCPDWLKAAKLRLLFVADRLCHEGALFNEVEAIMLHKRTYLIPPDCLNNPYARNMIDVYVRHCMRLPFLYGRQEPRVEIS